ncbi:MAG TPA: Coq4 family protein [Polyangia bacterium]
MRNPLSIGKAAAAFIRLTADMGRLNEVFNLSDGLAGPDEMREMVAAVREHATGAAALRERPHVHLDLKVLRALPEGTLGRRYAIMMDRNGLDPASIPTLPDDDDGKYVRAHLYETHDLWHVATGFSTDVPGELGLQAFYQAQLPGKLPAAILASGFLNTLIYSFGQRDVRLREIARGWLIGRRSRPLFGVRWDDYLALPLAEARVRLGIEVDAVDAALPPAEPVQLMRAAA